MENLSLYDDPYYPKNVEYIDGNVASNFVWKSNDNNQNYLNNDDPNAIVISGFNHDNKKKCTMNGCIITGNWPTQAKIIGSKAFFNTNIFAIPISWGSITKILDYAFLMANLKDLPKSWDSVNYLGVECFSNNNIKALPDSWNQVSFLGLNCFSINNLNKLPTSWGSIKNVSGFKGNNLGSIPSSWGSVTFIHDDAFSNNKITSLPSSWGSVTTIGAHAFQNNLLTKLPNRWENVKEIGKEAFKNNKLDFIGDKTWTSSVQSGTTKRISSGWRTGEVSHRDWFYYYVGNVRKTGSRQTGPFYYSQNGINLPWTKYYITYESYEACYDANEDTEWEIQHSNNRNSLQASGYCTIVIEPTYRTVNHEIFENIFKIGDLAFIGNNLTDLKVNIPGGKTAEQIGLVPKNISEATIKTKKIKYDANSNETMLYRLFLLYYTVDK